MTPWTCFRYSKCLRKWTDTYLLHHRSRRRFPRNYRLLLPHWARTRSGYVPVPYRTGNRLVAIITSVDSTSGWPAPSTAAGTVATEIIAWTSVNGGTTCLGRLIRFRLVPWRALWCLLWPSDTGGHPLISDGLPGCSYHMTSYQEEDAAEVDPTFCVQLHHPRFLECIGAPESARLLGRSSAEWVQTIDRQDIMAAALQLQWDAGLMASNLQVLGQYVTSLNRMSSEVLRLAFGPEVFPSDAVDNAAPVPGYIARPLIWQLWDCGDHQLTRVILGRYLCHLAVTVQVV